MGIAERKERNRRELRGQIVAAARTIVLREGFDALTMRKIADAVEYSPAALYLHFASREAIGRALCAEIFTELLDALTAVDRAAAPLTRLRAAGLAYVRFGLTHPEEYKLLFLTDSAFVEAAFADEPPSPDDPDAQAFAMLEGTVAQAQAAGELRAGDPRLLAESMWAAIHGVVALALTCRDALTGDPETIAALQIDALIRGCAPA